MLSALILVCYQPISDCGFVNYDDTLYVTDNVQVQAGLTLDGLIWAFRDMKSSSNWHPVTWISHMVDWQLFRENAGGHHWTNVIFHLLNTILLFLLLRLMTGATARSACVAALFAVHPLNVESVAWVAERKNVLSMFFGLLTLLLYVFYTRKTGWRSYLPVMISYALGLMAKPMLVTLPFVMILLDFWPLRRTPVQVLRRGLTGPAKGGLWAPGPPVAFSGLLREKIPLFMMAAGSVVMTLLAARQGGALTSSGFPLTLRLANGLHAYAVYLGKFFWPVDLAVFYPYPVNLAPWQTVLSGALIASLTVLVLKQARSRPYLVVGWLWFLGTLIPVIGLVQVGLQAMADRYAYLPLIGLFIMAVWGAADFSSRSTRWRVLIMAALPLLLLAGGILTHNQLRFWESSRTLFSHVLSVTERNDIAHSNLARALFQEGDWEGAVSHYREAIRINPNYPNHYNNLGTVLVHQGKPEEAIVQYGKSLALNPRHTGALFNMGLAMESMKNLPEADSFYARVLREDPDHRDALGRRAMLAMQAGNQREAAMQKTLDRTRH
ncbi:MAG: tetratricopeptide repeat protein [Deltaproteobacteria bacterium]|nr:tetratricopeptide repeat protein [Deltaproteobacteria bacterium]